MNIRQVLLDSVADISGYVNGFLSNFNPLLLLPGVAVLIALLALLFFLQKRKMDTLKRADQVMDYLLKNLQPSLGIEKNLNRILEYICPLVTAHGYAFYIYDSKKKSYVLKAVKYAEEGEGLVGPSYSGLLPYKEVSYVPPISIPIKEFPRKVSVYMDGKVPILEIPVKGQKAIIRTGPVHKVLKESRRKLDILGEKLEFFVHAFIETEELKNKVETVVASSNAVHSISSILLDDRSILNAILGISIKTIGALGAFFIQCPAGKTSLAIAVGLDKGSEALLREDVKSQEMLLGLMGEKAFSVVKKGEKNYYNLPAYFAAAGMDTLILVRIGAENEKSLAVFWYGSHPFEADMYEYRRSALILLSKRLGEIMENHRIVKEFSKSYIETLQILANMIDNLTPYTVGYSEQMARYSTIVAQQLGVGREELQEIYIAAYLSNIGIIGLSSDLFSKEGRFTELEYEMVKLHADVGASIVETMLGNPRIASYIRHHHERVDGYGYPAALKDTEIPLGARIIAVVQTFLAKINSRNGRSPLPFDKALELLQSSAGTQLDTEVVTALVQWFRQKQEIFADSENSLGPCWEMNCTPASICETCPAFGQKTKNCWEFERNCCKSHGNECSTCFVKSEVLSRSALKFQKDGR